MWAGVALAVLIPPVYVLGNHVAEHPEFIETLRRFGLRGLLGVAGTAMLAFALLLTQLKPSHGGVPCPNCHEPLYRYGVTLGMISGNCCHCGKPLFEEKFPGVESKTG